MLQGVYGEELSVSAKYGRRALEYFVTQTNKNKNLTENIGTSVLLRTSGTHKALVPDLFYIYGNHLSPRSHTATDFQVSTQCGNADSLLSVREADNGANGLHCVTFPERQSSKIAHLSVWKEAERG